MRSLRTEIKNRGLHTKKVVGKLCLSETEIAVLLDGALCPGPENPQGKYVPHSPSKAWLSHTAAPIMDWWAGKTVAHINGRNCRACVGWRTAQTRRAKGESRAPKANISDQTARHELKTLRAALRSYHAEYGPLSCLPKVTLPERTPQRTDYWLTRKEAAKRVHVARKRSSTRYIARMLLIGVYTGTRPGAILGLKWIPSTTSGYFDLDTLTLHRRGSQSRRTNNKRQPPARNHDRLLPHLRRRHAADPKNGVHNVIHYFRKPIGILRNSWQSVAKAAGATRRDSPHIIRHTAATWQMQAGTDLYEAAGYRGMSPETLWGTYGHHHLDFQSKAASAVPRKATKRDHAQETPRYGREQNGNPNPEARCFR